MEHLGNKTKIERSILWKIYFCFILCLDVLGVCLSFSEENFGVYEIVQIPNTLIAAIGLFGYAFSRRLYKQTFWFCFFWFSLFFDLAAPFLSEIEAFVNDPSLSDTENIILNSLGVGVTVLLILPSYVGLLLYGLPSNKLWEIKSN